MKEIFLQLEIEVADIELGRVNIPVAIEVEKLAQLKRLLLQEGFELLDDQKTKTIEEIKNAVISLVHYQNMEDWNANLSDHLSNLLHREYSYLSNLFSSTENITIEQFFLLQKIEKVKEWLVYSEYSLSEIAYKLDYSSTAHLSNQFKKITGFTPTTFKRLKHHNRKPLDEV
jgi:AraC-like DNA-binding protein